MKNRQAWWTVAVVILGGHLVITTWYMYRASEIVAMQVKYGPAPQLADRIDKVAARIKTGQLQINSQTDRRFLLGVLHLHSTTLREEPHKYDYEIESSRVLFYTALVIFLVQLALAFSAFFFRWSSEASAGNAVKVPSNSA